MSPARATKSNSDRAQICRKLVTGLQKLYGKSVPRLDLPVLETFLFAICLEDNSWEAAQAGYQRLLSAHFDLNEMRVSSVTELEQTLLPLRHADWKGLRIRSMLRYIFESTYSFDFEKFRRLTPEVAVRNLKKVNDISPFVRDFALQYLLGGHLISLDGSMLKTAKWLGLVPSSMDIDAAGESLRSVLKKAQAAEFCHFLRCLATDEKYYDRFLEVVPGDIDSLEILDRLQELQSPSKRKVAKAAVVPIAAPVVPQKKSLKNPAAASPVPEVKSSNTTLKKTEKDQKSALSSKSDKKVHSESESKKNPPSKKNSLKEVQKPASGKVAVPSKSRDDGASSKSTGRKTDSRKK